MCANNVNLSALTPIILSFSLTLHPQANRFGMSIDHNNKCILNKYNLNIINSFEMNQFSKCKNIYKNYGNSIVLPVIYFIFCFFFSAEITIFN